MIEQVFLDNGFNLYEDRQDVHLATVIYYLIPVFEGRTYLDGLLAAFQNIMRSRTQTSLNGFATALGFEEPAGGVPADPRPVVRVRASLRRRVLL